MASPQADTTTLTDEHLVLALRNGDDAAFTVLLERYHASLVQLAQSFVREPTIANGIVREALRDGLDKLASFDGRSSLGTWLFGFVIRHARSTSAVAENPTDESLGPSVDPARFRGPEDLYYGGWRTFPESWEDTPHERLRSQEALVTMRAALAGLAPAQQRMVLLRDVHGCSAAEVSELLGISEAMQRALLHHGRTRLRQALATFLTGER